MFVFPGRFFELFGELSGDSSVTARALLALPVCGSARAHKGAAALRVRGTGRCAHVSVVVKKLIMGRGSGCFAVVGDSDLCAPPRAQAPRGRVARSCLVSTLWQTPLWGTSTGPGESGLCVHDPHVSAPSVFRVLWCTFTPQT
jgi:hypothetical protein